MNAVIEMHDSVVVDVTTSDGNTRVLLSPAYIHRSPGEPGIDAGTGWHQDILLVFEEASVTTASPALPKSISDGSLKTGDASYENLIPCDGVFEGPVTWTVLLQSNKQLTLRAGRLTISPASEAKFVERFEP